jgi:thiaminase/transcriptional activator TenA
VTGRSAALVARHREALAASADRPLIREAIAGTVDPATYARYLAVEEDFVRAATRAQAHCAWAAPTEAAAAHHAEAVAALAREQTAHFARLRPGHPVDPSELPGLLDRAAGLRRRLLTTTSQHGYAGAVVSMLAAETLYLSWCRAAVAVEVFRHAAVQEWIELHVTPGFVAQVAFLADAVDALDPAEVADAQLDDWFAGMLRAEDAFHDAVLPTAAPASAAGSAS